MKHNAIIRYCCCALLSFVCLQASAIDIGVSYAVFSTPDRTNYIEVNLEIAAVGITWTDVDSAHVKSGAAILILVKQGEQVFAYEKYELNSPVLQDPLSLLDVKRLVVPNGDYDLSVSVQDLADTSNYRSWTTPVKVAIGEQLYMSKVQLLRSISMDTTDNAFTKNGYHLEPLPFYFYDRNATTLAFYFETYNSVAAINTPTYLMRYILERQHGNGVADLIAIKTQKKRPSKLDMGLMQMDIAKVPTGNYSLTVELRNAANDLLLSRRAEFQRSNPFLQPDSINLSPETIEKQFVQQLNADTLIYSMKAITPLVVSGTYSEELKNLLAAKDYKGMRFFLFRHFISIDPNNPELAYRNYMNVARKVDDKFHSGFRHGFETDRGRMFLRYGTPDDIVHVEDDPAAPPYEIWVYYNFPKTQQRNVKFLFYNPSLAGEDYIVLHSTARGEVSNPKWERTLYRRNAGEQYDGDNDFDATRMQSNINRNARAYFEDF